jgi:hypothetical protein
MQSRTKMTGVPPRIVMLFRYRALTREGQGEWSRVIAVLVT